MKTRLLMIVVSVASIVILLALPAIGTYWWSWFDPRYFDVLSEFKI